jgi:DNA-binding transcriptional LysR family regulator
MDIMRIDLNLLAAFEVLMHERNVTKAADRLCLSQPAVSAALGRLRDALGDPLFVRTGRGIRPTPRALELVGPVNAALGMIRASLQNGSRFDPATSCRAFTLMLSDIGEIMYLPRLIARVKREAPGVRLFVRPLVRSIMAEELDFGSVDIALGFVDRVTVGLRAQPLFDESYACMVRHGHPRIRTRMSLRQFLDEWHLLVARKMSSGGGPMDGMVEKSLQEIGAVRKVAMSVPHFLAVPLIIAQTDLLVTAPIQLGEIYQKRGYTRLLPLPFPVPTFRVSQFWHSRFDHDAGNVWLRGILAELFKKLPDAALDSVARKRRRPAALVA